MRNMREAPRAYILGEPESPGFWAILAQLAVSFAAGVLAGLGQAPFSLVFLSLPGFAAIFWLIRRATTTRGAMILAWASGAGYFTVSLFWIVEPFMVDIPRHGWMAPFALIAMVGGLSAFWAAAGWLARRMAGADAGNLALGIAWVVCLCFFEYLRGRVFTGFPWAMPGYIWSETGIAQIGAILGPHGLNFLTLGFGTAITGLAFEGRAPKMAGVLGAVGSVGLALGMQYLMPPPAEPDGPMLRLVQPNAPQHQKWDPDYIDGFYKRALEFTLAPPKDERPEIVIWPETSMPRLYSENGTLPREIAAAAGGADVIVGAMRRTELGLHNSLLVLGPAGGARSIYDKHHLVPFGEYIPFAPHIASLGWRDFAASGGGFA